MKGQRQSQILKKTTKILAGKNIDVFTEGFAPRVEYDVKTKQPVRVFIPEIPDIASDELIAALHGYIDHECGHILESSNDDICDTTKNQLWHYIHNCIEDPRVNAKMSDRYPGCEANIRRGYNYIFNREEVKGEPNAYAKETVDKIDLTNEEQVKDAQVNYSCVWFAKKANCRFNSAKYDELELDRLFAPLEAKANPRYLDALSRANTTEEVKEATDYFVDFFHKEFEETGGGGGKGEEPGKGDPSTGKPTKGRLEDLKKPEDELAEAIASEFEHLAKKGKKNFHFSNRFDIERSKHDIAKLYSHAMNLAEFETETKTVTNYLSKDLRRLLESRNRRWWTGGFKSGKLNQKSLHSVRVGNDRIFSKKSEIREVKAAVSLLIDLSGSMSHGDGKGTKDVTKVMMAAQSAYAFALVLEQLKVPYEVYGFTTVHAQNPGKVAAWNKFKESVTDKTVLTQAINTSCADMFMAFKKFEENFDLYSKQSLIVAANKGTGLQENEDSLHVKAALERLASRPEDKKTLFVFSDGQPAFRGEVKPSQEMLMYLDRTSKENYGVDIFGIGIMSDAVKRYYKNYKVVNTLNELPAALFEFLKTRI
jgi:hypothetical protein